VTGDQEAGLFEDDPITEPLTYPGRIPATSGVLIDTEFHSLWAAAAAEPARWRMSSTPLSEVMQEQGGSPMSARVPVVAVGSNAAPSQLFRKFGARSASPLIPVTLSDVSNLVPGVSAHVSKPGYIPAAPVKVPGAVSRLFVLWLDNAQLGILDDTEPNYWRRRLPTESCTVRLESGVTLPECFVYVGKHGCLLGTQGQPRQLTDQRTLIQELLDESPLLRTLCGESPEEFVLRVQDAETREAARRAFVTEGKVSAQPDLIDLPGSLSVPGSIAPPGRTPPAIYAQVMTAAQAGPATAARPHLVPGGVLVARRPHGDEDDTSAGRGKQGCEWLPRASWRCG
jgi:hypothetical protein